MYLRSVITSLMLVLFWTGCTNQELNKDMIQDRADLSALNEQLGLTRAEGNATFKLYAPTIKQINLVMFDKHDDIAGVPHPMAPQANGVWSITLPQNEVKGFYAYQDAERPELMIADPYSRAVTRQNHYRYPSKTVILPEDPFDWQGDQFTSMNLADMVILEAHLRDMSVHPSSQTGAAGSYLGFVEPDQRGGIAHLVDMGYNAIEFLPLQEFGNIEIDFKNPDLTTWNDWNPYENNHWGYMTSFFFAPEVYYGTDGTAERGVWTGQDGRAVDEMKTMVRELHKKGISVIVDVVYNHVSQYDENPFKLIDKEAYFRLDDSGNYLSHSGCGNDFKTEHPMARKMIVESLEYWMREYHIDGFRFDLAAMIDMETVDAITEATRAINPDAVLIGEPWGGGGYNPAQLAKHGWPSWNDHFRNSIKGRNPDSSDVGFIFGRLWDGNDLEHFKKLHRGYLAAEGGHYQDPVQSVNYLESHDDYTMGDFIRIALGKAKKDEPVDKGALIKLSPEEIRLHKFAALNLMVSQGPIMIAQGQSWGRTKVIANSIGTDPNAGHIDHNSYEKDDETNWLNWDEKDMNSALVDYYRGLIAIRVAYPELRNADPGYRTFLDGSHGMSFGISLTGTHEILVLLNADNSTRATFDLGSEEWTILADHESAGMDPLGTTSGKWSISPSSGAILVR